MNWKITGLKIVIIPVIESRNNTNHANTFLNIFLKAMVTYKHKILVYVNGMN